MRQKVRMIVMSSLDEIAAVRYSAAYPTGAERMLSWSCKLELENGRAGFSV